MKKRVINSAMVFVGLMLSPITWWNDPFINIPLSYLAASFISHYFPEVFAVSFIFFYWFTNILGILFLFYGGEEIIKTKITGRNQVLTVVGYTILILLLSILGIIKPIALK